jgi:hypothetical protein
MQPKDALSNRRDAMDAEADKGGLLARTLLAARTERSGRLAACSHWC